MGVKCFLFVWIVILLRQLGYASLESAFNRISCKVICPLMKVCLKKRFGLFES